MKQYRNPSNIHPPIAGYVHQIEISGPERLLVVSGQVGIKDDGTVPEDPIEQLKITLDNLERNLLAADMKVTDLVKLTFYLVGDMDAEERKKVLQDWFGDFKPCMMLMYVSALAAPQYRVEVEAMASHE